MLEKIEETKGVMRCHKSKDENTKYKGQIDKRWSTNYYTEN